MRTVTRVVRRRAASSARTQKVSLRLIKSTTQRETRLRLRGETGLRLRLREVTDQSGLDRSVRVRVRARSSSPCSQRYVSMCQVCVATSSALGYETFPGASTTTVIGKQKHKQRCAHLSAHNRSSISRCVPSPSPMHHLSIAQSSQSELRTLSIAQSSQSELSRSGFRVCVHQSQPQLSESQLRLVCQLRHRMYITLSHICSGLPRSHISVAESDVQPDL